MSVRLYSTNCPKCRTLAKKLDEKNVEYSVITDVSEMQRLGFTSAPILKVDDKTLNFGDAIRWVKNL